MIYLSIFWIIAIILVIAHFIVKAKKDKDSYQKYENIAGFFTVVIAIPLLIMAILTNDPISLLGIELPVEVQWIGSILISGFGLWKLYLNPMKLDVNRLDREVGELKGEMKGDIQGVKGQIKGMHGRVASMEKDLHLVKEMLLKKA